MAEVRDVSGDLDRFFLLVRNPVTEEWPSPEREWANAFLADCIGSDYLFDCYIKSIQEEKQDPTVPPDFTWIIRSALQDLKSLSVSDFVSLALC
ncbi:MAG: hypothetical protein JWM56_517, partial [Candidatus Peribacteria bacterium]|nr:hypothetical protein [Candidatus Peribacteria bacterium]